MYDPFQPLRISQAWMRYSFAWGQMSMAAGEIILRRTLRMTQGAMTGPEAVGMVMEKATALAASAERAAVAAASGGDPARIATAALKPFGDKTRSNLRKYRR